MKKHRRELCMLGTCSKASRLKYLRSANSNVINAVSDAAHNILRNPRLGIKGAKLAKVRRQKPLLKKIANRRSSVANKRHVLSQKGGNILGTIWNVIKELF